MYNIRIFFLSLSGNHWHFLLANVTVVIHVIKRKKSIVIIVHIKTYGVVHLQHFKEPIQVSGLQWLSNVV